MEKSQSLNVPPFFIFFLSFSFFIFIIFLSKGKFLIQGETLDHIREIKLV
jgi:hypothetical protein